MKAPNARARLGRRVPSGSMISARRVRAVVAWLLRSPLARLLGQSMLLLELRGRRSRIPLQYAPVGDALWVLVTDDEHKRWWRDLVHDEQPVALWMHGHRRFGRAQVVSDTADPDLARSGWTAYTQQFPATVARLGAGIAHTVLLRILLSDTESRHHHGPAGVRTDRPAEPPDPKPD
jgi:hypothetical protein